MTLNLVARKDGYQFFKGLDSNDQEVFNVIPEGQQTPTGGYYNSYSICNLKGVINIFKYLK